MTRDATTAFARTLVDEWARHGVTDACVAPGSRSAPLALALAGDDRVRVHRGGHRFSFDQEEAGVVAAFDRLHGQFDHTGQCGGDTAGSEEGPRGLGEAEGELGKRVAVNGSPSGAFHGVPP